MRLLRRGQKPAVCVLQKGNARSRDFFPAFISHISISMICLLYIHSPCCASKMEITHLQTRHRLCSPCVGVLMIQVVAIAAVFSMPRPIKSLQDGELCLFCFNWLAVKELRSGSDPRDTHTHRPNTAFPVCNWRQCHYYSSGACDHLETTGVLFILALWLSPVGVNQKQTASHTTGVDSAVGKGNMQIEPVTVNTPLT